MGGFSKTWFLVVVDSGRIRCHPDGLDFGRAAGSCHIDGLVLLFFSAENQFSFSVFRKNSHTARCQDEVI